MVRTIILYHFPCPDGVFAALAAHLYFARTSRTDHGDVCFWPHKTFAPIDRPFREDDRVYLLDYIGPETLLPALASTIVSGAITVLDHHKTAREFLASEAWSAARDAAACKDRITVVMDMDRSGAVIARDHFAAKLADEDASASLMPADAAGMDLAFAYIQDRDLWRWEFPETKFFGAALAGRELDFDAEANPELFSQLLALPLATMVDEGRPIVEKQEREIAEVLAGARVMVAGGGKADTGGQCMGVLTDRGDLRSDVGNRLAEMSKERGMLPIGIVAYREELMTDATMWKVSLRSLGDCDTSAISKAWGGGGHRNASSCLVPKTDLDALWLQDA